MTRRELVLDSFVDSANRTYTTTDKVLTSLQVVNRGSASLTLQINGLELTVDVDEILDEPYDLFSTFTILATGPYEVLVRGYAE